MKVTFKDLNDHLFNASLAKLGATGSYSNTKALKNVFKLIREFKQEQDTARDMHLAIVKDHAELDEQGNLVPGEKAPYVILEEKQESYETKMREFMDIEVEMDCRPVRLADIPVGTLSPQDILVLEPVMEID